MRGSTANQGDELRVAPAESSELDAGLALAFGHLSAFERSSRTEAARRSVTESTHTGQLWLARQRSVLCGAVWIALLGADSATVAEPRITPGASGESSTRLLAAALASLEARGVRWVQALVAPDSDLTVEPFRACGFQHVCDLIYLSSERRSFPSQQPISDLKFVPCSVAMHPRLSAVVEQTYQGSLDCPTVEESRTATDMLASYQAASPFDPERWLLVRFADQDVGCLVLADHSETTQWEIQYMGLVPQWRGKGWGLAIVRYAQWLAGRSGQSRLTAAVDATNFPAQRVYEAAGFIEWNRRRVLVRTLGEKPR
jgi:RimJ/RimL family protein N-acetyltransferase